jgi:hypothetical protein
VLSLGDHKFLLAFWEGICYHKWADFPYRDWLDGFLQCPFPGVGYREGGFLFWLHTMVQRID